MRRAHEEPRRSEVPAPAGPYEVRFRLERSYRRTGYWFLGFGLPAFLLGIMFTEPVLFLCTGPACAAGIWLLRNDPREYLVVIPRRRRLRLVRSYGKSTKVRGEWPLAEFDRLELARYLNRPKGLRAMILLWRPDGTVEKVDDRPDDADLPTLLAEVAEVAGLRFEDRGRVDEDEPRRRGRRMNSAAEPTADEVSLAGPAPS